MVERCNVANRQLELVDDTRIAHTNRCSVRDKLNNVSRCPKLSVEGFPAKPLAIYRY